MLQRSSRKKKISQKANIAVIQVLSRQVAPPKINSARVLRQTLFPARGSATSFPGRFFH